MKLRHKQGSVERLTSTAGDAAGAVAEIVGTSVRNAGSAVGQQVPEMAGRIAGQVQPVAETAQKRAADVAAAARERSADFAEKVVQAAYEATKSLPKDTRKKVEGSLRKTGIEPPKQRRHIPRVWLAAGVLAAAGVAFLFSGTVQDRVYDLVDRIRGEDDTDEMFGFPPPSDGDSGGEAGDSSQ